MELQKTIDDGLTWKERNIQNKSRKRAEGERKKKRTYLSMGKYRFKNNMRGQRSR